MTESLFHARRDRLACALCNAILNVVATRWYREAIRTVVISGLASSQGGASGATEGGESRAFSGSRLRLPTIDPSIRIDPSVINRDDWRTWARENLDGGERARMLHAIDADEAAE